MDTKLANQIPATKNASLMVKTTIKSGPVIVIDRR